MSFFLGVIFGLAQLLMAKAFSLAPANLLTPFTYFQILSALVFGFLVFGDIPDMWTFVGIALIVGAGLYVFGRSALKRTRFIDQIYGKLMKVLYFNVMGRYFIGDVRRHRGNKPHPNRNVYFRVHRRV